jgi:hypothetical protein
MMEHCQSKVRYHECSQLIIKTLTSKRRFLEPKNILWFKISMTTMDSRVGGVSCLARRKLWVWSVFVNGLKPFDNSKPLSAHPSGAAAISWGVIRLWVQGIPVIQQVAIRPMKQKMVLASVVICEQKIDQMFMLIISTKSF